jgi:hypothetical protein
MRYLRALLVVLVGCPVALAQTCDCYWSADCGTGNTCGGYGSCTAGGKSDGTCRYVGLSKRLERPASLGAAVDSFFKAYEKAIERGGGVPDADLVRAAEEVPLSRGGHDLVEYAVWVSLDAVIGWDFMYPSISQRATGDYYGNIREVGGVGGSSGLVDAARRGLLAAMQSGDSADVVKPIQEFWASHHNFAPHHLGRCYPHGHEELTSPEGSLKCQVDTLQRLAGQLIGSIDRSLGAAPAGGN